MSSFIGHSLNTLGVYVNSRPAESRLSAADLLWLSWLGFVGLAPDVDYVIPALYALRASLQNGVRVTHSLAGCLTLPLLTVLVLSRLRLPRAEFRRYAFQVCLAGLSHTVMDLLVGVWPLPLFWPVSAQVYKLPWGILPSAPSFRLDNVYMYRNVLLEVGIFVPLYAGLYLCQRVPMGRTWRNVSIVTLWSVSLGCMYWAFTLAR